MAIEVKDVQNSDLFTSEHFFARSLKHSSASEEVEIGVTSLIWVLCGKCFLECE